MAGLPDLDRALARFGHESFRPGQRESIDTLLDLGKLLLVAPTGGGKSLTYQLPAALLPGTTLVVSPLIALMHDQVAALEGQGVSATYLAGTLEPAELRRRMSAMSRGAPPLRSTAPRSLRNASQRPSGLQRGAMSCVAPSVSRRAGSDPSVGTSHRDMR